MNEVLVIGGGASGLMAALTAAKQGAKVTLLEKNDRIGRKLSGTGNGRCNFTNKQLDSSCYYHAKDDFLSAAFSQFDNQSVIDFFQENGILVREKNGYCYPYSMRAEAVTEMFRLQLLKENVHLCTGETVQDFFRSKRKWTVQTQNKAFATDHLIVAAGTAASVSGYTEQVLTSIRRCGHHIIPFGPALTWLKVRQKAIKQAAGVRFPVKIDLYLDGEKAMSETGELQITSKGISGICVFQLSRYITKNPDKQAWCLIDFLPDVPEDKLQKLLLQKKNMEIRSQMNGLLPDKLTAALLALSGHKPEALPGLIRRCRLDIEGTGSISESQVLCGGVDTRELDPETLRSKCCKDLWFCGEIVDIDGKCGGYNLQWAWTSGYLSGKSAAKREKIYDSDQRY